MLSRCLSFAMRGCLTAIALTEPAFAIGSPLEAASLQKTVTVRSVNELRAAIQSARMGQVRVIQVAAGRYALDVPIEIDAKVSGTVNAPFTIEPVPGAKVEFSGAPDLPALSWQPQKDGIWRARVTGISFQRLWLGSRLLVRARYPNYDPEKLPYGGVSADSTSPARVARWANPKGGILQALHGSRWGDVHVPILGKDANGNLRYGMATGNNRAGPPSVEERFVENIREELDAPGEWYHDEASGWLYYKPGGTNPPPRTGFRAGRAEELIRVTGSKASPAHDIRIVGISFRGTEPTFLKTTEPLLRSDWMFHRGGAVLIADAERISVEDGDFSSLGGNAIVVSGHARAVAILRNRIYDIGASAIAFVGKPDAVRSPLFEYNQSLPLSQIDRTPGPKTDDFPADSIAQDNLIHDIGLVEKQSAGVEIAMAARISVDHNSIYRVPRAGINIGDGTWGGHRITNNDVFDTVRESGDHGAFNSWGRDRYWHPDRDEMDRRTMADRSLVTLDAIETIVLRHNRFQCDHGWDVDLDDGSSNYVIEDNLLLSGGLKLREGFDRVARNNIMINNSFHPHVWFDNGHDVFEHNIVMAAYQPIRVKVWGKTVDYNLFPTEAELKLAQANGTDTHSLAGDPQFVNPTIGNYSVRDTSPAMKIGFHNFGMTDFGVRTPRLRALAESPRYPAPIVSLQAGHREVARRFADMTLKSVETLGEQSAAGLPTKNGVMVLAVDPNGAGGKAGLQPGDVILAIDGSSEAPGLQLTTAAAFVTAAQGRRWQGSILLTVFRNQKPIRIKLGL